jgi:hypothetical protein
MLNDHLGFPTTLPLQSTRLISTSQCCAPVLAGSRQTAVVNAPATYSMGATAFDFSADLVQCSSPADLLSLLR